MKAISKEVIKNILSDLETMLIKDVSKKYGYTKKRISDIRFEFEMIQARKKEANEEIYSIDDLDGEELRIFLNMKTKK